MTRSGTHKNKNATAFCFAIALSIAVVCLSACTIVPETHEQLFQQVAENAPQMEASNYRVSSGDKLKVVVFGEDNLTGTYTVDGSQHLVLPLVGAVYVAGLSTREVEDVLEQKYADGYLVGPQITVEVAEGRPFYIMGEVRKPGGYAYIENMSVLNAVAVSGGFTYRADTDDIIILRKTGGREDIFDVDMTDPVMPGDVVTVKERFF
ncbi:MAG: polysaccharide export protein [Alphaproteobacteria bacterium]|nr:polysaccharide export protein [Alphaproteobacteria bacterium]